MAEFTPKDLTSKGFSWNGSMYVKTKEPIKSTENRQIKAPVSDDGYTTISLCLLGVPMPKQSVQSGNGRFFQPAKKTDRLKDYQDQIIKQLPILFKPFKNEVLITKMHFIYPPLKSFQKQKGKMERIHNGELIPKTTVPDLPDNLKKLVNDAMSGLVYRDDCIIWGEDNTRKYYGTGGCVIIELKGK